MTWRIPPIGWCVRCLKDDDEERPAVTLIDGTGSCYFHTTGRGRDDGE